MLYQYQAIDAEGRTSEGTVDAQSEDMAVTSLQRRGLTIVSITSTGGSKQNILTMFTWGGGVSGRDVVLLSREISTLFEAQVSALRVFQLLAEQAEKAQMREALIQISDDLQAGENLSRALEKHPKLFSDFFVSMVRAGEETGKLDQTFAYLADYLDRSFELTSRARNALIYPAFVLVTFIAVVILMLTFVIPKITPILTESGGSLPVYTQLVISLSMFFVDYGVFLLIAIIIGGFALVRWMQTPSGKLEVDRMKLSLPFVGDLYRKLYLARLADNMHVMLSSGIAAVRALEISASVVDNTVFRGILSDAADAVKTGSSMSAALRHNPREIPPILTQMIQVGEETGELGSVLERLSKFYQREVNSAVDTLVSLIEPALIVALAVGVGFLLASILVPIYNLANTI